MQPPMLWPMTTIGFVRGKALFHRVELLAQDRGGIGIGIAARIAVKPELVMLPDDRIAAQLLIIGVQVACESIRPWMTSTMVLFGS